MRSLDQATLDFCISLLDQRLAGEVFKSILVAFLTVLSIDQANVTFYDGPSYTLTLSDLIKIAQMLKLQKAVFEVKDGRAQGALDPLEDMRRRFITLNNYTPFA